MPKKPKNPHRLSILRQLTPYAKQKAFAEFVGIPVATLQSIELGRRQLTPNLAKQIMLATGIDPEWLLGNSDDCALYGTGEFYDTGTIFLKEELTDAKSLILRLTDPQDRVGQFVLSLLIPEISDAVRTYAKIEKQPIEFNEENLFRLRTIVNRLKSPPESDLLGKHLRRKLSKLTLKLLDSHEEVYRLTKPAESSLPKNDQQRLVSVEQDLKRLLALDFDKIIRSGSIFDPKIFEGALLPKKIIEEILGRPDGETLIRLNIRLLSWAFPEAISLGPILGMESVSQDLASGFWKLIRGKATIFDAQIFAGTPLRTSTKTLLRLHPTEESRWRLNRLLLEDAFPNLISREHSWGFSRWRNLTQSQTHYYDSEIPLSERLFMAAEANAQMFSEVFSYSMKALLIAGETSDMRTARVIQKRLLEALHDIASDFGLEENIYSVLNKLKSQPDRHPRLDINILDEDDSWEWLFYRRPRNSGPINPMFADWAKQLRRRFLSNFKRYRHYECEEL